MRRLLHFLAFYALHLGFLLPLLHVVIGIRYRGRGKLPAGPCLIVANHNSHLDAPALMHAFPLGRAPRIHPVAAADYFGSNWFRRALAMFMMNAIAFDRKPKSGEDPLGVVKNALEEGRSLIFFPEGSRGVAGVVAPFRQGVGRLVQEVPGLLVVPIFLSGAERIWPRGSTMLVPLGIDVHIGRPRTYDKDLRAREIAGKIREDVLALAPPPPPVPGPRPAPPKRLAVCGIDPEAVDSLRKRLTGAIGEKIATIGIGNPTWVGDEDGVHESTAPVPTVRSRFWLRVLGGFLKTATGNGEPFAETLDRGAVDEALQYGRRARVVVGGGGALVDLLARAFSVHTEDPLSDANLLRLTRWLNGEQRIQSGRWWSAFRLSPAVWFINVFDLARLPAPDAVVFVESDPAEVMRRLRSTGRELREHETEADLALLQQAYRRTVEALGHRSKLDIFETRDDDPEAAIRTVLENWEIS